MSNDQQLVDLYESALHRVIERGWGDEVQYFRELTFDKVDGRFFFREYAFCVYASGFSNYVLNSKWEGLSKAYKNWNYEKVCQSMDEVRDEALKFINFKRKVEAILECAQKLNDRGWPRFKDWLQGMNLLIKPGQLKFIGPATRYHLARNIGANVAKPDRYMLDRAAKYGYPLTDKGVQQFAIYLAKLVGERVGVVDYVLWRDDEGSYYKGSLRSECMKTRLTNWKKPRG